MGDESVAPPKRSPPELRISDTLRFEFLSSCNEAMAFEVVIMSFTQGQVDVSWLWDR